MTSVAVFFGGRSVEHDVSIISGIQVVNALEGRHLPVPVYVDREGRWYTGEAIGRMQTYREGTWADGGEPCRLELGSRTLVASERGFAGRIRERPIPIDVAFPAIHGSFGEDGCLQGLLELAGVPYVGSGVMASAVAMHKPTAKAVLRAAGVPVVDESVLSRSAWAGREQGLAAGLLARHGGDVIVKPVALGSSIGVARCSDPGVLSDAVELVLSLDREAMVEPFVASAIEVNCSVLGRWDGDARTSVCEQPLATGEVLSFEDKYMSGGKQGRGAAKTGGAGKTGAGHTDRLIPAPVDDATTRRVQAVAETSFRALGCAGVVRVDCFVRSEGDVLVNEVNTVPGSFSFYLWEPSGVPFPELCDRLLRIADAEGAAGRDTIRSFESALLGRTT